MGQSSVWGVLVTLGIQETMLSGAAGCARLEVRREIWVGFKCGTGWHIGSVEGHFRCPQERSEGSGSVWLLVVSLLTCLLTGLPPPKFLHVPCPLAGQGPGVRVFFLRKNQAPLVLPSPTPRPFPGPGRLPTDGPGKGTSATRPAHPEARHGDRETLSLSL